MNHLLFTLQRVSRIIVLFSFFISVSACEDDNSTPSFEVNIKTDAQLGTFLTDSKGFTLYYFTKDVSTNSNCNGACLTNWPAFYKSNLTLAEGLNSADFGEITRGDGTKQTTYKGRPLYYFVNDTNAGDTKGNNSNKVWFVAQTNLSVMLANQSVGGADTNYLVDATGRTLYFFTNDTANQSNCSGGCLTNWPEFYQQNIVVPSGINASDFGTITRADGKKQTTYKQKPLYYFNNDTAKGNINGQGVNNVWFVAKPDLN
jgi:predicted lipoprotein with Yx(FWY)xxD motif